MSILDETGLTTDRFADILTSLEVQERLEIDPEITSQDNELLGLINNIIAERISDLNELARGVYDAINIEVATGRALDVLAALRNTKRIPAAKSTTTSQRFTGTDGTVVPAETILRNPATGDEFITRAEVTITSDNCRAVSLSVASPESFVTYSLQVRNTIYSIDSGFGATAESILLALKAAVEADSSRLVSVVVDNNIATVSVILGSEDVTVGARMTIESVSVIIDAISTVEGAVDAPIDSVTELSFPITGVTSTTNTTQYVLGRDTETDDDLRSRITSTASGGDVATIPAIINSLTTNVVGISSVALIENETAVPDADGRQANSYEPIITGGEDSEIADEVFRTKPAGIPTIGSTERVVIDTTGTPRTVRFTRPAFFGIAVDIAYTLYDEEVFPVNGEDLMRQGVYDYINGLEADEDVIPARIQGPLFLSTDGIQSLTIRVQNLTRAGDVPIEAAWQDTKLGVSDARTATTELQDIYITGP